MSDGLIDSIATVINTGVVVFGGYLAWRGVDSWRSEMVGRRQAELAEATLAMFYEANDHIAWARTPVSTSGEGTTRQPLPDEQSEGEGLKNIRDSYYVTIERMSKMAEFWGRFDAARYTFMAVFGRDAAEPFREVREVRNRVMISVGSLIRTARREEIAHSSRHSMQQQREKWENDIGWGDPADDPIKPRLAAAIAALEAVCRPSITGYHNRRARSWLAWPKRTQT